MHPESSTPLTLGAWVPHGRSPRPGPSSLRDALQQLGSDVSVVLADGRLAAADEGSIRLGARPASGEYPLVGWAPPLLPESL